MSVSPPGRSLITLLCILLLAAARSRHGLLAVTAEKASDVTVNSKETAKEGSKGSTNSKESRDRSHIETLLELQSPTPTKTEAERQKVEDAISQLITIYNTMVQPMEALYNFRSLNHHMITEAEIQSKPMVLFVGPWSTGKSTMINYLVGVDNPVHTLRTGAEPTTSDFTVVLHGEQYRTVEGLVLASDSSSGFAALEQYGQGFLERLQGVQMPHDLLKQVTLVDTPGIIENRKQQERGYPFNEVMKWFIDRSDLIFVVFDPTKLDVGIELETLFQQLKGREGQLRIILNKADSIAMQELMHVYGALFWSLQPLINVTEPPRVYTGSFWNKSYKPNTMQDLFDQEEASLLHDLREIISNQLENKVAFIRQHAILVRIHALTVNQYLKVFNEQNSWFRDNEDLLASIVENPDKYHIFQSILSEHSVSKYDLPAAATYREFFQVNALNTFKPLSSHCSLMRGCPMDSLAFAIGKELPQLLRTLKLTSQSCSQEACTADGGP